MEKGFIDRFENGTAVIEIGGKSFDIPKEKLPANAKPGDAVLIGKDGIRLDPETTVKRKKEIEDLMDDVFE